MTTKISKESDIVWKEVEENRMTEDEALKLVCDAEMLISSWDTKERQHEQRRIRRLARQKLSDIARKQGYSEVYIHTMLMDL